MPNNIKPHLNKYIIRETGSFLNKYSVDILDGNSGRSKSVRYFKNEKDAKEFLKKISMQELIMECYSLTVTDFISKRGR